MAFESDIENLDADDVAQSLLGSTVGDRGCAVPTVYSPKGGLLNDGQQSQIKIGACYPSEERVFATYNNTPYGTRNTTYEGFTTYRPEGASAAANTSAAFYPNASRADGLPRFHVDVPGNVNLTVWRSTMEELRLAGYVDPRTRVVDVHFNLYNPASQYFIAVRVSFRLAHTGGVWADAEFMPVHTQRHLLFFAGGAAEYRTCFGSLSSYDVLLAVLEIFFLLMVVMVLFLEVAFVFEQKLAYLFQAAHFISLATVGLFIAIYTRRFLTVRSLAKAVYDHAWGINAYAPPIVDELQLGGGALNKTTVVGPDDEVSDARYTIHERYLDLYPLGTDSEATIMVLAITTLFVFAYCLVFMRLSPKLGLLTSTLSIAAVPLFWFGMFFMTIFTSYALAFHLAFGMDVGAFSSVGTSMYVT